MVLYPCLKIIYVYSSVRLDSMRIWKLNFACKHALILSMEIHQRENVSLSVQSINCSLPTTQAEHVYIRVQVEAMHINGLFHA